MDISNENVNLESMSFDLGEDDGGRQMILAHKRVNENEHYLFTLGNGPKKAEEQSKVENENAGGKKMFNKQMLLNIRDHFVHKKNANEVKQEADDLENFKFRCFKLSKVEGKKYLLEEYVTPEGVCNVARLFDPNIGKEEK